MCIRDRVWRGELCGLVQRAFAEQPGRGACALPQRGSGSGLIKIKRSQPPILAMPPVRCCPPHLRTVRNMTYSVQRYTARTSQPSTNKLSTPPPTAIGDKCGFTQNFLHRNRRKSVTYPKARFLTTTGCFLIESLQGTFYVAYRGWQTPYPQKRQQTLGATFVLLWKTDESRDKSGFQGSLAVKTEQLIVF